MQLIRKDILSAIFLTTLSFTPTATMAAGPGGLVRGMDTTVRRIVEGANTLAPFASVVFCMKNRDQCTDTGGDDIVTLDDDRRAEMLSVNSGINRSIRPQNDSSSRDVWSVDVRSGDCEDYALTKRKHLIALGWPSRALRIAVATTRSGEGHAVLIAKTSAGDMVLDNRTSNVRDWKSTDLHWIKMQSKNNPMAWVSIGGERPGPMMVSETW